MFVQRRVREDVVIVEHLLCALPYQVRRRARKRTAQLLRTTFLLELLKDEPTVFAQVTRHEYPFGANSRPFTPDFSQRFTNAVATVQKHEIYFIYRNLHSPVFEVLQLLFAGRNSREARSPVVEVYEALRTDPVPLPCPLSGDSLRSVRFSYQVLEPRRQSCTIPIKRTSRYEDRLL